MLAGEKQSTTAIGEENEKTNQRFFILNHSEEESLISVFSRVWFGLRKGMRYYKNGNVVEREENT